MLWTCCPSNFSLAALGPHFLGRQGFGVEPSIDRSREKEGLCCGTCCSPPYPGWLSMTSSISPRARFYTVNLPYLAPATDCRSCRSSPEGVFSGRDQRWPRFVTSASQNSGPPAVFCTHPHLAREHPAFVAEVGGGSVTCTGSRPVLKASRSGGGLGTLRQQCSRRVSLGGGRSRESASCKNQRSFYIGH